ncbi:MAG: hypothetical protein ACRCYY_18920 [Trueperaceae bacterium]
MQQLKKLAKNSVELFQNVDVIQQALQKATRQALERHKRLGESVAVWQDGKVVILEPKDIPDTPLE